MGARALVVFKFLLGLRGRTGVQHLEQLELDNWWWVQRPAVFPCVPGRGSVRQYLSLRDEEDERTFGLDLPSAIRLARLEAYALRTDRLQSGLGCRPTTMVLLAGPPRTCSVCGTDRRLVPLTRSWPGIECQRGSETLLCAESPYLLSRWLLWGPA